MTERDLRNLISDRDEARKKKQDKQHELAEIGRIRSASDYSLCDHPAGGKDPTAKEFLYREGLRKEISELDMKIKEDNRVLRNFFRRIHDSDLRLICRRRLQSRMSWAQIAELVNLDVPAVKMRYYRFCKGQLAAW